MKNGSVGNMKFMNKLRCVKWGIILIIVGIGVIFSLLMPAEAMVVILSLLLIFVGLCLLNNDKRKF